MDLNTDTVHLNTEPEKLIELQQADTFFKSIMKLPNSKELPPDKVKYYLDVGRKLYKRIQENNKVVKGLVIPTSLKQYVFHQAHDILVHNSSMRMYNYIKMIILLARFGVCYDQYVKKV